MTSRTFGGRFAFCSVVAAFSLGIFLAQVHAQLPEASTEPSEAEIEPSPIPDTELRLEPQLPPSEAPMPGRTLKLGPPAVVEPILPPVNLEALGRSGRLWSFHGVVKEFLFAGNRVFSTRVLGKVVEKYKA